ncbi:hypothetical protein F4778DRAFT_790038 [Xylariomycetidae sp. FL2044]|nr:hypothetical protein F4778DRAFT_790038 [Xylariomycetidae sp. FL2044]
MEPGSISGEDPVVIVGFSFRFPQDATSEDKFWDVILQGKSTMEEVPPDRYNIDGFYAHGKAKHGTVVARGGHFLKGDLSAFDAPFFNMSGMEARAMDPQLRLLLETSYHAFESAGMPLKQVMGTQTSVYVGSLGSEYSLLYGSDDEINEKYQATGTSGAMISNRVSRFYDLHGPSVTLDTACSSSLMALHLAVQSLHQGESEMSLVCGSQLQMEPRSLSVQASRLNFLSPDSHSYSFDERANGYSRGEGIAVVILKRLSKAMQDGDTIRAVIRGTSANQDGRTASSTQPSAAAQAALIRKAYEPLEYNFQATGYFEAHGTGTAVGDPIEVKGINSVFCETRTHPLHIGSVKANIGHLEAAAGLAGLIKAILVLEKGIIPPNALLQKLNPAIEVDPRKLNFPTSSISWPSSGIRRASINSFGFGGANVHVIIDDALHYMRSRGISGAHHTDPDQSQTISLPVLSSTRTDPSGAFSSEHHEPTLLFPLTAADEAGLQRYASLLASHLAQIKDCDSFNYLTDLAWTLCNKRSILPWKSFVAGSSIDELQAELRGLNQRPLNPTESPTAVFAFTGQGAQWKSMGAELFGHHQAFRDSILRADSYFMSLGSTWSLVDELYGSSPTFPIDHPSRAQPSCTAIQVALVDLLASWGICPIAVVGHSSGEIAAAYAAGTLTAESAWKVAYFRGEVVSTLVEENGDLQGSMLAVGLSESELAPHIAAVLKDDVPEALTCACVNSPRSTTVSGLRSRVGRLAKKLQAMGVFAREIQVPVAYHSSYMLGAAKSYAAALEGTLSSATHDTSSAPKIAFFSSVTGGIVTEMQLLRADYWVSNLISKVRFSEAFELMAKCCVEGDHRSQVGSKRPLYLVEIGPHCALERSIKDMIGSQDNWSYDCVMRRGVPSSQTATSLAGRMFAHGFKMETQAVNTQLRSSTAPQMLVGLPSYPFEHTETYWLESQLSKNHRFQKTPRNDLLGSRSREWNPMEPKWRFTIRASDLPWILDHKIEGTIIYPAAGMLVMALEGIQCLTEDVANIEGYRMRDVSITSALLVPATDGGVEAQLHMHQKEDALTNPLMQTWEFRIYSVANDVWKLHCSGQICAEETQIFTHAEDSLTSDKLAQERAKDDLKQYKNRCSNKIDETQFYKELAKTGAKFGATFQRLKKISANVQGREATAEVSFAEWARLVKDHEISPHMIHPTTLDSLLQIIFAAGQEDLRSLPTMVPTRIADVYFTRKSLSCPCSDTVAIFANVTGRGISSLQGNVTGFDGISGDSLVKIQGCFFSGFRGADSAVGVSDKTYLFHQLEWKPDISLMSKGEIENYCIAQTSSMAGGGIEPAFEKVARYFMVVAAEQATAELYQSYNESQFQMPKYIDWLRGFILDSAVTDVGGFHDLTPEFLEQFASTSLDRRNLVLFGQNLVPILKGEVDALALLFNEGILDSFYQSPLFSFTAHRLAAYVDLLAHKKSDMNIIEVGAGTGSTTSIVLDTLYRQGKHSGSARFTRYDFTDISPAFFASARERYTQQASRMRYVTLDLEKDPISQGFEPHSYDVVIAVSSSKILMTPAVSDKSIHRGGKLLLSEPTNLQMASIPFFSGVLQGWWRSSESYRATGPLLSKAQWGDALERCGFDELCLALPDGPEERHGLSLLVSSVRCPKPPPRAPSTVIVQEMDNQTPLATTIQAHLHVQSNFICDIMSTDAFAESANEYDQCICLWELGNPILHRLCNSQFKGLQHMVKLSKQILWINDSCGETADKPEATMIAGFAKTIAREKPGLSFVHLNVELGTQTAMNILRIIDLQHSSDPRQHETDFLETRGTICIPRVVEAPHVNKLYDSEMDPSIVDMVDPKTVQKPLKLTFVPGELDSLRFAELSIPEQISPDEVEVRVMATGINFKDVLVALNRVHADNIGQEFAGEVTRVGSALEQDLRPGDRVCGISPGTFRTHLRTKRSCIMRVPGSMPYTEAAANPLIYVTAQYALTHVARLEASETILIHAAAGGVGQAAIQIAQKRGAKVLVTVGSLEKRQLLMDQYGIDPADIFSSRQVTFAQQVMRRTNGKGIDVVLNSLSGRALTETWRCLAPLGRFIEIGKRDIDAFKSLPMSPFQHNVSFSSVDIGMIAKHDVRLLQQLMEEVEQLVYTEATRKFTAPHPRPVFGCSQFEEALRLIQTGHHVGKIVIDWEGPGPLRVIRKSQLGHRFDSNATYVIAGGFGGIGRHIADWMHQNGAKHLILLSRSGPRSEADKKLLAKLEDAGVVVYPPQCDITDSKTLGAVIRHAEQNMPPIRGCIQSSMVVKNRVFADYSLEEFESSIQPKVRGTWNLHHALPEGLDFFVLLSSLAGVHGASSQSNYAAGSAFLDGFARYRHSRGEHCVSLDLGLVENIGYVAERLDIAQTLAMTYTDQKYLTERDLNFMLGYACTPPYVHTSSPAWDTQLICGMTTPAFVRRAGTVQDYGWMRSPIFCHLYQMEFDSQISSVTQHPDSAGSQLRSAASVTEAADIITALLARRLARSLSVPVESIDTKRPPFTYGVDSLVAVELLHWFSTEIRTEIPVVQILGSMSIAELAMVAAETSEYLINNEIDKNENL